MNANPTNENFTIQMIINTLQMDTQKYFRFRNFDISHVMMWVYLYYIFIKCIRVYTVYCVIILMSFTKKTYDVNNL